MTELRRDGFLDGRLQIWQPAQGYRSGADAVMLAAACPARDGDSVLELGSGAGVAALCLGLRVRGARITALELQPDYAALAMRNALENSIPVEVVTGDLARMPAELRARSFDQVMMNPPYFPGGTRAPDAGRAGARHETTPLALWVDAALRRLRPRGTLTVIQHAERLDDLLVALHGRAGGIEILPVAARAGRPAGRVILRAIKGARRPLALHPPFIMHAKMSHSRDGEDFSPAAHAILRQGASFFPVKDETP